MKKNYAIIKVSKLILAIYGIVVLCCAVYWLCGGDGLYLDSEPTQMNDVINRCIGIVLFMTQFSLRLGIVFNLNGLKLLIATSCYLPFAVLALFFYTHNIISTVLFPNAYILIIAVILKQFNSRMLIRTFAINAVTIGYQAFFIFSRMGIEKITGYEVTTVFNHIIFNIDFILFLSIIYLLFGDYYGFRKLESVVYKRHIAYENDETILIRKAELALFNALTTKKKIATVGIVIAFQIFQLSLVLMGARVINTVIETLIISATYVIIGILFKCRYHTSEVFCTLITVSMFTVASLICPPLKYSQMLPVIIGYLCLHSMYLLACHKETKKEREYVSNSLSD